MEGLPNVVCEALACARPVIVSDTLDHVNLVQDGISGLRFDPAQPADLAEKILKMMRLTPAERLEMGKSGRKFAEEHLSQALLVDHYEQLFLSLLH